MSDTKCFLCPHKGQINLANAVQCLGCDTYYHNSCSKPERAGRLLDGSFEKCCGSASQNTPPLNITSLNELYRKLEELSRNNTKVIEDKITSLKTELDGKINNALERLDTVEAKLENPLHSAQAFEEFYSEMEDRKSRAKHVIMYGVPEITTSTSNSIQDDLAQVQEILNKVIRDAPEIEYAKRLGKVSPDKVRPIVLYYASKRDALYVLSKKSLLPQGTTMSSDSSPQQREYLKSLRAELNAHNTANPTDLKTIKYIKKIPRIISSNNQAKNSSVIRRSQKT